MSAIQRRGVLLDGIGAERVRSDSGGVRRTLSAWLGTLADGVPTFTIPPSGDTTGATDTAAAQSLLTAGFGVTLRSGATYYISERINITNARTGLMGDDTPLVIMTTAGFNNSSASAGNRYGTNAVGLYASGVDHPICRGVRFKFEAQTEDRYVKAVAFRNCTNIAIERSEAWNFTKAYGVIYFGGCTGGLVAWNYVHDCYTNSATTGQITGIEADNDDIGSVGVDICFNRIERLTVGASFLASFNYQTDGINGVKKDTKCEVFSNSISFVGEGIDWFGSSAPIYDNTVTDCYYYGVKFVHGPLGDHVADNFIRRCGIAGIIVAGSAVETQDTAYHFIINNNIGDIDPDGTFSGSSTACILFSANGGTSYLPRNIHVVGNQLDPGANGKYCILAPAGSGTLNYVNDNEVVRNATVANYSLDRTVVPFTNAPPYVYDLYLKAADIASASTTNIAAATGECVDITGTTTITAFGTAAAGVTRKVRFTGSLTLTHNGTSLILPGAVNITTAANDTAEFESLGSGNWVCLFYKRADGQPISTVSIAKGGTGQITSVAGFDALTAAGADIASATTTDIGAATGPFVSITGTTTITGLGTVAAGTQREVKFTGALTLTHNGTSLILPGSANITTAANDTAKFASLGSGNWVCLWYKRASGKPIAVAFSDVTGSVSVAQMGAAGYAPGTFSITASAINFNSANSDSAIAIPALPPGFTRYLVSAVRINGKGESGSLTTATCGLFTAASGGGTAIVTGGSAITVNTNSEGTNNNSQALTVNNGNTQSYLYASVSTLYFRIGTAQGATATANVHITITPCP